MYIYRSTCVSKFHRQIKTLSRNVEKLAINVCLELKTQSFNLLARFFSFHSTHKLDISPCSELTFILNETLTFLFYLSRGATGQEKRIAKISGLNDEYHKLMNWQPLTKLSQFPEWTFTSLKSMQFDWILWG